MVDTLDVWRQVVEQARVGPLTPCDWLCDELWGRSTQYRAEVRQQQKESARIVKEITDTAHVDLYTTHVS